ncbi:hypothetical protein EDB85DRAFT_2145751 [Lactarius pseudohatsudake]|nr:hypothetical protein EDB85DRAFT_2145751 [Lactarius pseudohatsudake]
MQPDGEDNRSKPEVESKGPKSGPRPRATCQPPPSGAPGPGGSHPREVRILPRVSTLCALSLSVPAHVDADAQRVLLAEFRRGWEEAVAMFNGSYLPLGGPARRKAW